MKYMLATAYRHEKVVMGGQASSWAGLFVSFEV